MNIMADMLTAKEMQTLLQVDRSTIYRMAESGRLPAMKVGKQWRFPADQVESWLQIQIVPNGHSTAIASETQTEMTNGSLKAILPLECVQLIQDTFADLLGIMLVVTDMDGNPITKPSHTCGLFDVINGEPQALQRCIKSWHDLATTIDLQPQFSRSHLGLLCTRAMIRVGDELKGMVVAGCVAPDVWPPSPDELSAMAAEFGVDEAKLAARLDDVFYLDQNQRGQVLETMQRIANIVAHIVNERKTLVGRLAAIANLTTL
jgi:excisionase family DNA binding protein